MKNKKALILSIVAIVALVCITVGISLAFFNYAQAGTTDNTLETGSITFLYTETSTVGRGIAIEDAFPVSNEEGKALTGEGNVFDFNIGATKSGNNQKIDYEITARKSEDSTLSEEVVVMYLTKVNGVNEEEVLLDKYNNLTQTEKTSSYTEKTLYKTKVFASDDTANQDYRLRMWITNDGSFKQEDMGKTFTVTVNVYANATVVTDSQVAFESNTNIETLSVNNSNLEKVENKDYDYETVLDEGTTSTTIEINTENPNATIDIENVTSNYAYTNIIQKTSTTRTLENLVTGNNYFKITIISENDKVEDEYVVKVQVGNDKFSEVILNNNTLVTTNPTLTTASSEANENGLYSSTDTNTGEPTYYFRGNVENNYVSFAGLTWRIVRINEDGTVRLILQDGINNNATYKFNTAYNSYKYIYYTNSGTIKPTVDSWYQSNLSSYSDKIATGNYFCEQAKVKYSSSYTSGSATMAVYTDYTPDFKCSTDGNGKGVVNSNIGLITYDEMVYAGGYCYISNSAYYLNNSTSYWSMSPAGFDLGNAFAWYMYTAGSIDGNSVDITFAVRPVINLNADIAVTGTGTSTDPYVVE